MPKLKKTKPDPGFYFILFSQFQMLRHWLASQEGLGFTTKLKVESKCGENVLVIFSQNKGI
jgi:hypothetical protein